MTSMSCCSHVSKYLLSVVAVLMNVHVASGQDRDKYLTRGTAGFHYSFEDGFDSGSGLYGRLTTSLSGNLTIGQRIRPGFIIGLGLVLSTDRQELNPERSRPEIKTGVGAVLTSYHNMIHTNRSISPVLFGQCYRSITNSVAFAFDLYSLYRFETLVDENTHYFPSASTRTYSGTTSTQRHNVQYLTIGVRPSMRLQIFPNGGIEFSFGLAELQKKVKVGYDLPGDVKSFEVITGFKPENWLLGAYYRF